MKTSSAAAGQQQQQPQQQPAGVSAVFTNSDVVGAKLYYNEDSFMGDLPVGGSLRFNSFKGHRWTIKDAAGSVVGRFVVDDRPAQTYVVANKRQPSTGPSRPPGSRASPPL